MAEVVLKSKKIAEEMVLVDPKSRVLLTRDFGCLNEARPVVLDSLKPAQSYEGRIYHRAQGGNLLYIGPAFRHEDDSQASMEDYRDVVSSLRDEDYLVLRGVHSPRRWKSSRSITSRREHTYG